MVKKGEPTPLDDIPHQRSPDFSKSSPREKLPVDLQKLVDDDETLVQRIYEGNAKETTDSSLRYAAYGSRIRTALLSAQRYVAYTSDVAESFRPVAHPYLMKFGYSISWLYLLGDVSHEGYKAYTRNQRILHPALSAARMRKQIAHQEANLSPELRQEVAEQLKQVEESKPGIVTPLEDYRTVMAERALFQSIASMGLPALTIHSVVRYSGRAMKGMKNTRNRTWGPIGLGLAVVPFLPFIFDEPVEKAVSWTFHKAFAAAKTASEKEKREV